MAAAPSLQQEQQDEQDPQARAEELLRLLKAEESEALGYRQSELQQQQIDALKHYYGEKYGDEEDGRSQVVTREVFETIQWTLPDLMRIFASGSNVISMEETNEEDANYSQDAANYLNWIFHSDNPGFQLLHDFAFDGLLQRNGFIGCYWRDKEYRAPQELTGLSIEQVQQLMQDQSVEIIGHEFDEEDEGGPITLKVRRVKSPARAEIVVPAPEDMRLNGRAVDIDSARYVGRVVRMLRGEIARMWPEKAQEINEYSGSAVSGPQNIRRGNDVRMERFKDNSDDWQATGNNAGQEIELLEEYLRVDLNGDGYPEMIRSYRMGDLLLEEEEVEEHPFGSWSPIPVPHRFIGLSFHDITHDLQRRSTVLTRAALDATYQSVVNREAYDANKVKDVEALAATYAGAKIPVDGDPASAIFPLTGGLDTANTAWEALNQLGATLENRTGATRQTQGVDPDALLKGAHSGKAIDLLQTAGGARKELTARHMGSGLSAFFSKLHRLVCRNQNEPRAVKVGGKWAKFDPRAWNADLRAVVHAGLGTGNRDQTMLALRAIGDVQTELVDRIGMAGNPFVDPAKVHRWLDEFCRAAGWRDASPFFNEPPDDWQPQPQPSPEMAKVEADKEAKAAEMQLKTQEAGANLQLQQQKDSAALSHEQEKAALTLRLEQERAAAEISLAREKAAAEIALAREKAEAEIALEARRMAMEERLEEKRIESQERIGKAQAEEAKLSKNRPGGDLDK